MAKSPKSDPTKDPEFQKVVSHFLKTPPERHKPAKPERKPAGRGRKAAGAPPRS